MRNRSPLAAQSKVGYRKHTQCASMSQRARRGTDDTRRVGRLDPLMMGPSPSPSWTPNPMGTPRRATSIRYIHTERFEVQLLFPSA